MSDGLQKKFRPQRYPQRTKEEQIRAAKAAYRHGDFQEMNVMIYLDNIVEIYHPAGGRPRSGRGGLGRGRGGANAVANGGPLAEAYAELDNEEHQQDDVQEQEQHEELLLAENEMCVVHGDADLNEDEEDEATRFGDVFEEDIGE